MKAWFVLSAAISVATAAACSGSTGDGGLTGSSADAGTNDGAAPEPEVDAGPDPFEAAPTCTSGKTWSNGDRGSVLMHPGRACIDCHSKRFGAPKFKIAGTVYPTAHEPNECNGVDGTDVTTEVVITDANGEAFRLPVNSAGNFFSETTIATPYTAKVVANGKSRSMGAAQTVGDCNSCHTQDGLNGAPGRIVAP